MDTENTKKLTPEDLCSDASDNVAELLSKEQLEEIGEEVVSGYETDKQSRKEWEHRYEAAIKLAKQISETKSDPWDKASNVKYPLISIAAIQFHARAYPSLIPADKVLSCKAYGPDPQGIKMKISNKIALHMNYQLHEDMPYWDEDMDRLLITLAITGSEFKKIYFDKEEQKNVSEHVFAKDLIVNYYTKTLEQAPRITHLIEMSDNEVFEKRAMGIFLPEEEDEDEDENEQNDPRKDNETKLTDEAQGINPPEEDDETTPDLYLEQHTWLDLDDDGYKEPYIVVVDEDTAEVLRIVARYDFKAIKRNDNGELIKITPENYFVKYPFIPSPDGGFYDMGFGTLLGPINHTVDTLINQLVDSGSLSNLQAGFISKALKIRTGSARFKPGEWKEVNATGMDLKQGIFPLPVREPSQVLFKLLDLLLNAGQTLSSTVDLQVGENPGQNQKVGTTQIVNENGMKVFTAIYKRVRRSMEKEFVRLFELNKNMLPGSIDFMLHDQETGQQQSYSISKEEYMQGAFVIRPTADPSLSSKQQKREQNNLLLNLMNTGMLNNYMVIRKVMETEEIDDIDSILIPPEQQQPKTDPKTQVEMAKLQETMKDNDFYRQAEAKKLQQEDQKIAIQAAKVHTDAVAKDKQLNADMLAKGVEAHQNSQSLEIDKEANDIARTKANTRGVG